MKKTKRFLALGLTVAMTAGLLAGCGGSSETASSDSSTTTSSTTKTEGTTATTGGDTAAAGDAGISADSPYAGMGFDLSERKTVVMYALGDRPADMDAVLAELNNTYLIPWLNSELEMQFLNWSDYSTKYSLVLAGGETVDLMYTASWCYYNDEAAKGAFLELTPEWLAANMPISYPQQPAASWDQISIGGKIFAVPRSYAPFNGYNFFAARKDLMDKYGIESIGNWDEMKDYLLTVAADTKETGISASGMTSNRDEFITLWRYNNQVNALAAGHDFDYVTNNSEKAPMAADVFYWYTSDLYKEYCLEMAELAKAGVWSANAINDTNESRPSFENGTSASFVWNETIYDAGKALEDAGLGEYVAFDISPDVKRARGSYADDAVAIATNSKDPVRAALVLDCLKGFKEVNNMILGGIEGTHFSLNEAGERSLGDSAANYPWNSWAWGIQRGDQPKEAGIDPRKAEFSAACEANVFEPESAGFTFDKLPVETELNVINSIRDEYKASFWCGAYGDDTEAKFEEFKSKIEAAGLDKVMEEVRTQYIAFCEKKGYAYQ